MRETIIVLGHGGRSRRLKEARGSLEIAGGGHEDVNGLAAVASSGQGPLLLGLVVPD